MLFCLGVNFQTQPIYSWNVDIMCTIWLNRRYYIFFSFFSFHCNFQELHSILQREKLLQIETRKKRKRKKKILCMRSAAFLIWHIMWYSHKNGQKIRTLHTFVCNVLIVHMNVWRNNFWNIDRIWLLFYSYKYLIYLTKLFSPWWKIFKQSFS